MRKSSAVAAALVLAVSTGPCFSGETKYQKMLISEETVKIASAWVYSDLLRQAYEKGWRYDPSHIESGFKRHFEELKLQLIDQGHTIVPDEVGDPCIAGRGSNRRTSRSVHARNAPKPHAIRFS